MLLGMQSLVDAPVCSEVRRVQLSLGRVLCAGTDSWPHSTGQGAISAQSVAASPSLDLCASWGGGRDPVLASAAQNIGMAGDGAGSPGSSGWWLGSCLTALLWLRGGWPGAFAEGRRVQSAALVPGSTAVAEPPCQARAPRCSASAE